MYRVDEIELVERGKKKFGNNTREDKTGESESEQLVTEEKEKMDYRGKLDKDDEKLLKNDGELQYVHHAIETLMEQKKDLNYQREKLVSLLHKVETQIEKYTNNLKSVGRYETKKRKMYEETKQDMEMSRTEHAILFQNTMKVLETTEDMIMRMTEMKGKLEERRKGANK